MRPLLTLLALLALSGCVSAKPIKTFTASTPIRVTDGSKTIAIKRVASTLSKGAEVGAIQGGLACVGQRRLQWSQAGQLASGPEQLYTDRIRDEFRGAGYNVAPTATENTSSLALFQDNQATGDFLLAAVIKDVAWNFCYPYAGFGNVNSSSGEASVEIEWHLYDPEAKAILFSTTTGGSNKSDTQERGGMEALMGAVGIATRNLLADPQFSFYLTSGRAKK